MYARLEDVRSPKMRAWLARYLNNGFNATEAARAVKYADPEQSGWENKKKLEKIIQAELEGRAMGKSEALAILADHARASLLDVAEVLELDAEKGFIRLDISPEAAVKNGKSHLVKKVRYDKEGNVTLELHSAQRALDMILKAHGVYKEPSSDDGSAEDWLRAYRDSK